MRQSKHAILTGLLLDITGCNAWWQPRTGAIWQINLSNVSEIKAPWPNVTAFDADLFDVPKSTWQSMHDSDIASICYFSAGSWENWRPDADQFPKSVLGKPLDGWPGERWLNISSSAVRDLMAQRLDLAKSKNCTAVDPDNVDVYDNGGGGFNLTTADSLSYVKFLAAEAHKRGMACSLKNALALIPHVLNDVDFAVNEQCVQYQECGTELAFTKAGKPVFGIEYPNPPITQGKVHNVCDSKYRPKDFSTLVKYLNLNETIWTCPTQKLASNYTYPGGSSSSSASSSAMPSPTNANNAPDRGSNWAQPLLPGSLTLAFVMLF